MSPPETPPVSCLILPWLGSTLDRTALETMLQALALPRGKYGRRRQQVLALELVGSTTSQALLVRVACPEHLAHVTSQLQARFPSARILPIPPGRDPFVLRSGEEVTVYELRRGGEQIYLPLRVSEHHNAVSGQEKLDPSGLDPLLGLLAPLADLPAPTRVVLQLALSPAPEGWSRGYVQAADRYSLYTSRDEMRKRQEEGKRSPEDRADAGLPLLLLALLAAGGAALWRLAVSGRRPPGWLPPPLWDGWKRLVTRFSSAGPNPHLASYLPLIPAVLAGLVLLVVAATAARSVLVRLIGSFRRRAPLYDGNLVAQKTQRIAYHSALRLYAVSPAGTTHGEVARWRSWRSEILEQATAAYRQFHSAGAGYFAPRRLWTWRGRLLLPRMDRGRSRSGGALWLWPLPGWARGVARSQHLLTVAEIATLWHLPQEADLVQLPFLQDEASYRSRLAPRAVADVFLAEPAHRSSAEGTPADELLLRRLVPDPAAHSSTAPRPRLGTSRHAGKQGQVILSADLLGRHTLAIGGTGKGKSSLLLLLARGWLEMETPGSPAPGLVLLDPHGDLARSLLRTLPAGRRNDLRVLDLADAEFPFGLNPLDVTLGRGRDKTCEDLLAIFEHIWASSWGYRMEDIWRCALKTLYEANETVVTRDRLVGPDQQFTLVDVTALLTHKAFRRLVLGQIRDTDLKLWWQRFALWDMRQRNEWTLPVLNKVGNFGGSQVSRRILGQGRSTLNLEGALGSGRIVVVHTAAGIVGADTSALVGATILGLVQAALGSQARLPEAERRRTQVVIDEFQAIPGADYAGMLSELRKFGGVFVLATQSLAHLDRLGQALHATVLSNVGNLFAFGMSAEDAHRIAPELDGTITYSDLINVEDFTCYARLTQNGQRLRTFSLALDPPPAGSAEQEAELRRRSRQLLCRPRAEVEKELQRVMQFQLSPGWLPGAYPPVPGEEGVTFPEEEPDEWRNAPEPYIFMDESPVPEPTGGQTVSSAKRPRTSRRSTAAERQLGRGGRPSTKK